MSPSYSFITIRGKLVTLLRAIHQKPPWLQANRGKTWAKKLAGREKSLKRSKGKQIVTWKLSTPQTSVFTINVNRLLKAKFAKIRLKNTQPKPNSVLLTSNTPLMKRHRIKGKVMEKDTTHILSRINLVLASDKRRRSKLQSGHHGEGLTFLSKQTFNILKAKLDRTERRTGRIYHNRKF